MKNTTFIKILRKLDAKELKSFVELVESPFFNKRDKLTQLIHLIAAQAPDFQEGLEKERLYHAIYQDESYDESRIKNLISNLLSLLEDFLSLQKWRNKEHLQKCLLMTELCDRKLYKRFASQAKKMEQSLEAEVKDYSYYQSVFEFQDIANHYYQDLQVIDSYDQSLQAKVNALDHYYLGLKLKDSCEMLNRRNIFKVDLESRMLKDLLVVIERDYDYYSQIPAIHLYYLVLNTLRESENLDHYERLVKQLGLDIGYFSTKEGRELYKYAQNYCIKKINQGESEFLRELFSIYQKILSNTLILDNGQLAESDYRNIVTVALRLKEYDWVLAFIHDYKDFLPPQNKENAFIYNLSVYHYERKDYETALELIQSLQFTNVFYNLGFRSLLLKIYFEKKEEDALFSLLDSFNTYLRRNKQLSKFQQKVYANLLKFTRQTARLRHNASWMDKKEVSRLKKELTNKLLQTKQIANINWLKQQVEGI